MDKKQIAIKLRWFLESQSFADFYGDGGPFDKSIRGDYEMGTPERAANEKVVKDYLGKMVEEITK